MRRKKGNKEMREKWVNAQWRKFMHDQKIIFYVYEKRRFILN